MAKLYQHLRSRRRDTVERYSVNDYARWLADSQYGLFSPAYGQGLPDREDPPSSFVGYTLGAFQASPVIFALERFRLAVFSQIRFRFRRAADDGMGDLYRSDALGILERPEPRRKTPYLCKRALINADLAGNYFASDEGGRLRWWRPDWTQIVLSGDPAEDPDVDVLGYAYWPGGVGRGEPYPYTPDEVVHWAPIPDPLATYRGMSWITPVIREIQADLSASQHKQKFFDNGATLQAVVGLKDMVTDDQFNRFMKKLRSAHEGTQNAYRTMFLAGGADVQVLGADMRQLDFKVVQAAGEDRMASAAGVHPTVMGFTDGLGGSSLNQGNFAAARRLVADVTMQDLWRGFCEALETVVDVPAGDELWFTTRDVPFLREDAKDVAEIQSLQAQAIRTLTDGAFVPDAIRDWVAGDDLKLLKHTGIPTVQVQPATPAEETRPAGAAGAQRSIVRKYNPDQPRIPGGHEGGGRWGNFDASAIFTKVFKFRGVEVGVTAHDDESRTLDFGAIGKVRLLDSELEGAYRNQNNLRAMAYNAVEWQPGQGKAITRITESPDRRAVRSDLVLGVKKVSDAPVSSDPDVETWDRDVLSIHLPPNDDPSFDELMESPGVRMQVRDVASLAEQARGLIANRVETGSGGLVDVFRDGGRYVIRLDGGRELNLDRKGMNAIHSAVNKLWDEDDRDPRPPGRVDTLTVPTNAGDVTVRMTGEGELLEIITPAGPITVDRDHILDFALALGEFFER